MMTHERVSTPLEVSYQFNGWIADGFGTRGQNLVELFRNYVELRRLMEMCERDYAPLIAFLARNVRYNQGNPSKPQYTNSQNAAPVSLVQRQPCPRFPGVMEPEPDPGPSECPKISEGACSLGRTKPA
ncbi:uncharacterized protein LOC143212902 [Lasioglossum baleicum]|uniref:uncharacterized protein LOC143212902 n=1 Tax=Lasioglossum baleicum TaxID=434251 RepID=UPI003FCD4510